MRPEPYNVCVIDDITWRWNRFTDGCDGVMRMIRDAGVDMDREIICTQPQHRAVRIYCNKPIAFYDCDCETSPETPAAPLACPKCGAEVLVQSHEEFAK